MQPIILVNPKMCSPNSMRLPLSLLALAAVLEGKYDYHLIDGNVDSNAEQEIHKLIEDHGCTLLALTVMPGPQVPTAISISKSVRERFPNTAIVWGGYFPTLYTESALNAPYVDFVIRGQGEDTLLELIERLPDSGPPQLSNLSSVKDSSAIKTIQSLSWKDQGEHVHNADRHFRSPDVYPLYPYHKLKNVEIYLRPSFMGSRTAVHQAAVGCRYHCSFCGVVSMFNGYTKLPAAARLRESIILLKQYGANALQFYDHNFFDREQDTLPLVEEMARHDLPWWCYARSDALANASDDMWRLIQKSKLRMAYIGAEAGSDEALKAMRKGTRSDQTLIAAEKCRQYGVIPEFSFVLGGPDEPEEEIGRTFSFIRLLKKIHPQCEVILYFYSPTPQREKKKKIIVSDQNNLLATQRPQMQSYGAEGPTMPITPEEWTEKRWMDFVCHRDAPWLTDKIRSQVKGFDRVLSCRYPTVQDHTMSNLAKASLKALSYWRYAAQYYENPWELDWAHRTLKLRIPKEQSI